MSLETRTLVEASQTLGAAFLAGLRPHVWCLRGRRMTIALAARDDPLVPIGLTEPLRRSEAGVS
jgi:hypothetical protein